MAPAKKKTYRKKVIKSSRKTFKPTMAIKKYVKQEISRNIEDKVINVYQPTKIVYPSTHVNFQASIDPLTPNSLTMSIAQGDSQSQRHGNKIKIKNLSFNFILTPLP